jgi:hypothetical protein
MPSARKATDRLHVGVRIEHAARQPGVQRGEAGTDLAPQQPVLHAGSAVGVARQRVQSLRIGQQRAAAQLVLDEQIGGGSMLASLSIASPKCWRSVCEAQAGNRPSDRNAAR